VGKDITERAIISQVGCLCKAEKRMIHRRETGKAVKLCGITKEVGIVTIFRDEGK